MNWIEKLLTPFVVTTSSITMQSLGKIEQRCMCENMVFVCLFVFCHAPRPARCSFEGVYFKQVLCRCLLVDFDTVYSISSEGIAISDGLSHFCC